MVAIIYDQSGYVIGTNDYLTVEDDIQLPHFFVDEVPEELLNIPPNHRAKVNPDNQTYTYEAFLAPLESPVDRIAALEAENAGIALELAQNQIRFGQMEQTQADLLLSLVDKEVL